MLKIENVTVEYRNYFANNSKAIDGFTLSLTEGTLNYILGLNGAGKTTLFKSIVSLLPIQSGSIKLFDNNIKFDNCKKLIGYLPENFNLPKNISTKKLLKQHSFVYDSVDEDYVTNLFRQVGFNGFENIKLKKLSKGNLQRSALLLSIIHNPKLLLFDEPTNGLDIPTQRDFEKMLNSFKRTNKIIIISSHNITDIRKNADNVFIIHKGKMIKQITKINQVNDNDLISYMNGQL